jgi:2-amino-4-hydroxy-6-hydroxymethyldihydropteridine diphosphokinase
MGGQRWRARVLDLDILLWSEGAFEGPGLCIPHIDFAERRFVLDPLARIAAHWRDPRSGLTIYHLKARLDRKRPAA